MIMNITVTLLETINDKQKLRDEFIQLYQEAGWLDLAGDLDKLDWIDRLLEGSYCFVAAFHRDRMIGMGRSISDGVSDAYIQDVTVLKSYRGRGIGSRIMRNIISHLKQNGIDWIGLIAEPGSGSLYRKLGFSEMTGNIPMLLDRT